MFLDPTDLAFYNSRAPLDNKLGNTLFHQVGCVAANYDFTRDGGAIGSTSLKSITSGLPVVLPAGAIVTRSWIDVVAAGTTSASGTLAFTTGETAADILAATAAASVTGIVAGVSVGTAATMKKMTAARTPQAVIATGALTGGKATVFLEYVISTLT